MEEFSGNSKESPNPNERERQQKQSSDSEVGDGVRTVDSEKPPTDGPLRTFTPLWIVCGPVILRSREIHGDRRQKANKRRIDGVELNPSTFPVTETGRQMCCLINGWAMYENADAKKRPKEQA